MLRPLWAYRPGSGGGSVSDLSDHMYSDSVCAGKIHIVPWPARHRNDRNRAWDTRRTGVRKSVGAAVYLRIPDRRRIPIPGAVCTTGELFHNTGRLKLLCGIRNLESACISGEAEPLQVSGDPSQRSKEPAGAGVDRYRQLSEG